MTALRDIPNVSSSEYSVTEFVNDTPHPNPKYSDIYISLLYYGPTSATKGMQEPLDLYVLICCVIW